jgi:hypothetical protein
MKKLLFLLLLCGTAAAQNFYSFPVKYPSNTFFVCGVPAIGNPCSNQVSIFPTSALTGAVTQPATIGPDGNYGFWVSSATGQVTIQLQSPVASTFVVALGGGSATGAGGSQPFNSADMSQFGVQGTTKWIGDGSISSGSAVMTCPNNDCAFTQADVGKVCYATQVSTSNGLILPIGTITTVTDASHATCSGGNATATNTTTAFLIWGPDDDAALSTAEAATFTQCGKLFIHGMILVKTAHFITINSTYPGCNTTNQFGSSGGPIHAIVEGNGQINTYIIPRPDFNFTTCTGTGEPGFPSCFGPGGTTLAEFKNFTVDGFYVAPSVSAGSKSLFACSYICYDMVFFGWCQGNNPNCVVQGTTYTNQQTNAMMGGSQNFGFVACDVDANQVILGPNWACEGTGNNIGLQVHVGTAKTIGSFFAGTTNSVVVSAGTQWQSDFDELGGGTVTSISNSGAIYLNRFNALNLTNSIPLVNAATGKVWASNTNFNPGSGNWITAATGSQFFDQGGNKFTGGAGGTCGASCLFDSYSINQTACASGNFGFTSGWGTSAISGTPTGNSQVCQFTINTTVGGAAGPVLTYTFPQSFAGYGKTPNCVLTQVGGTFAVITNPSHVVTTTTDTITFSGTPSVNTYTFVEECR